MSESQPAPCLGGHQTGWCAGRKVPFGLSSSGQFSACCLPINWGLRLEAARRPPAPPHSPGAAAVPWLTVTVRGHIRVP